MKIWEVHIRTIWACEPYKYKTANVGINRQLTIEPVITNVRGYKDKVEDLSELKDVNLFSPLEMLTPGTVRNDEISSHSIVIY